MKCYLILFIGLFFYGCNSNNNKTLQYNKEDSPIIVSKISKEDKEIIQGIIKYNRQDNKKYLKIINNNNLVTTQEIRENYKKEYGYYPCKTHNQHINPNNNTTDNTLTKVHNTKWNDKKLLPQNISKINDNMGWYSYEVSHDDPDNFSVTIDEKTGKVQVNNKKNLMDEYKQRMYRYDV